MLSGNQRFCIAPSARQHIRGGNCQTLGYVSFRQTVREIYLRVHFKLRALSYQSYSAYEHQCTANRFLNQRKEFVQRYRTSISLNQRNTIACKRSQGCEPAGLNCIQARWLINQVHFPLLQFRHCRINKSENVRAKKKTQPAPILEGHANHVLRNTILRW